MVGSSSNGQISTWKPLSSCFHVLFFFTVLDIILMIFLTFLSCRIMGLLSTCPRLTWAMATSMWVISTLSHLVGAQTTTVPVGCAAGLHFYFFYLCDLSAVWGIVLEAIASAGIVATFILTIVLLGSIPFIQDVRKKRIVGTQIFFLLGTMGLFALVFDMIVRQYFATCVSRRFLFGFFFAICFSCLWTHGISLNYLVRRNKGLGGWWMFFIALSLTLVEAIINTEWLIITLVRTSTPLSCVENKDFVMALIYVMFLILAGFITALPAFCGRYRHWAMHAIFILITLFLSICIWITWIVMYVYGNTKVGSTLWDDPTLAIALVSNAWVFIFFYIIPEISHLTKPNLEQEFGEDDYPASGVGYGTILKEQTSQSMYVENKAFSMDEPPNSRNPKSPYGEYNGRTRGSVYQPTEMARMNKNTPELYDIIIPRATANTHPAVNDNPTIRADDVYVPHNLQNASNNAQNPSPYTKW
uniref:G protein-coupled receptor class C group 5 member C n=1 Tax=Leptobrachium leishanense TaxID=445787 RepID=A0A8C5R8L2_9ANUR